MKKVKTLLAIIGFSTTCILFAQMPEIKGAEQLLRQSPPSVLEAKTSIDNAAKMSGSESLPYFWYVKAYVYGLYAEKRDSVLQLSEPQAAAIAADALDKFYSMADEKMIRKYGGDANTILPSIIISNFNNTIKLIVDSQFKATLPIFEKIASLIKYDNEHLGVLKNGPTSTLTYNTILLQAYAVADKANEQEQARGYLQRLILNKYTDPKIYIYKARTYERERNTAKQLESIKEGRIQFPQSKDIISEEINFYVQNDKLGELKNIIQKEIEAGNAEPNFYYIRGYINDQIGTGAIDGNGKKGLGKADTSYLRMAEKDYLTTIELTSENLDATYNLAVLYTNWGNFFYDKASSLPYNETAKFDELTVIQTVYFNKAINYFEKADAFTSLANDERKEMYTYMKQLYGKTKQIAKVKEMNEKINNLK